MDILSKKYNPGVNELTIDLKRVEHEMGYTENNITDDFRNILNKLYHDALKYIHPCVVFSIYPPGTASASRGEVSLNKIDFKTGKIISGQLKKMDSVAIFALTIGSEFDKWSKGFFETGDPLAAYIADLIGSEFAESLADWLEERIAETAEKNNLGHSNRYSPGYCGWSVSEQHKLFSLLENDCGIKLTETALMQPIKSVSGIIGLGKDIIKKEYQCNICDIEFCYKRQIDQNKKVKNET
ncbi:MAG: hypothetical protein H6627_09095 [Calditrichae bacterium]|nr:hypothetical protein [Calditrichia bacterium]